MAAAESSSVSNGSVSSQPHAGTLTANYTSPTNAPFALAHELPAPASDKVTDKTAYLSTLRKAAAVLQEQVNKELTTRMEEDKVHDAKPTSGVAEAGIDIDEAEEEDNYGEEIAEED